MLIAKGTKLYKTAMADKGIRPLIARLVAMKKASKAANAGHKDDNNETAVPTEGHEEWNIGDGIGNGEAAAVPATEIEETLAVTNVTVPETPDLHSAAVEKMPKPAANVTAPIPA